MDLYWCFHVSKTSSKNIKIPQWETNEQKPYFRLHVRSIVEIISSGPIVPIYLTHATVACRVYFLQKWIRQNKDNEFNLFPLQLKKRTGRDLHKRVDKEISTGKVRAWKGYKFADVMQQRELWRKPWICRSEGGGWWSWLCWAPETQKNTRPCEIPPRTTTRWPGEKDPRMFFASLWKDVLTVVVILIPVVILFPPSEGAGERKLR